jgi:hypothetical protein
MSIGVPRPAAGPLSFVRLSAATVADCARSHHQGDIGEDDRCDVIEAQGA